MHIFTLRSGMETLNYSALLTVWWEKGTETLVWSEVPSASQRLWRNESKGCCCPLFQGSLVVSTHGFSFDFVFFRTWFHQLIILSCPQFRFFSFSCSLSHSIVAKTPPNVHFGQVGRRSSLKCGPYQKTGLLFPSKVIQINGWHILDKPSAACHRKTQLQAPSHPKNSFGHKRKCLTKHWTDALAPRIGRMDG